MMNAVIEPLKDETRGNPVPSAWRETFRDIARALAAGDFNLAHVSPSAPPVSSTRAEQMRSYVTDYGETLDDLPDESWGRSVSQGMGAHWDVLVDLWTVESGASDLVLSVRVFETDDGFRFEVDSLHVP